VTLQDRVLGCSPGQGFPLVGSVRGQLGDGLTTRSPEVGLGPLLAKGYLTIFEAELHQEGSDVTSQERVLGCRPGQWLSTGRGCKGSAWGWVEHPEPQIWPGTVYGL